MTNATSDEWSLVAEARAGNATAFDDLFKRYERRVFRIGYRITRNHEDAEDVVQLSFHRVFLHLNDFRGQSTFGTWLTRIAINEALMLIRRGRHNTLPKSEPAKQDSDAGSVEIEDFRPSPEQDYGQLEVRSALRVSVLQLRPSLRAVVLLRELRDFSTADTADALGLSVSAVKSRLSHARRQLRKSLHRFAETRFEAVRAA